MFTVNLTAIRGMANAENIDHFYQYDEQEIQKQKNTYQKIF